MATDAQSGVIMIRPRRAPGGSSQWAELITVPVHRSAQKSYGYGLTALGVVLGLGVAVLYGMAQGPHGRSPGAIVMMLFVLVGSFARSLFRQGKQVRAPHALEALKRDAR